jgi:hypothetical protein
VTFVRATVPGILGDPWLIELDLEPQEALIHVRHYCIDLGEPLGATRGTLEVLVSLPQSAVLEVDLDERVAAALPVSEVDAAWAHEQSLTEPGCEQRPVLTDEEVRAIVHEELLVAVMTESPPRRLPRPGVRGWKARPAEVDRDL